jgi:hypothetical protein
VPRNLGEQAISSVQTTYCRGVDRCDSDPLHSVYHPDSHHSVYCNSSGSGFADYLTESITRHGRSVMPHGDSH